jgi:UDP-glucose 4-epimerase
MIFQVLFILASKAVGESVENPLLYYENNINALVYVSAGITAKTRAQISFFSSSCTVYGQAKPCR